MDEPNRAEIGQVTRGAGQASMGQAPGPVTDQEEPDRSVLPDRGGRHAAPRPDRPRLHLRPLIGLLGLVLFMVAIGILLIRVINRQSFHWSMDMHVPVLPLVAISAVLVLTAAATALFSGRSAMSTKPIAAVKDDW